MPRYTSPPCKSDNSKARGADAYENHRTYEDIEMTQDMEAESHHSRIAEEHHDIIRKVRALKFWLLLVSLFCVFDHADPSMATIEDRLMCMGCQLAIRLD